MLAWHRLWVYSFASKAFRQMNIPETARHIRWSEFPRAPKFTEDGRYAAIPVDMSHGFLFEEGGVSHGTKILLVDMNALSVIETIQPEHEQSLVDFAVRNDGDSLTLATNWGKRLARIEDSTCAPSKVTWRRARRTLDFASPTRVQPNILERQLRKPSELVTRSRISGSDGQTQLCTGYP